MPEQVRSLLPYQTEGSQQEQDDAGNFDNEVFGLAIPIWGQGHGFLLKSPEPVNPICVSESPVSR